MSSRIIRMTSYSVLKKCYYSIYYYAWTLHILFLKKCVHVYYYAWTLYILFLKKCVHVYHYAHLNFIKLMYNYSPSEWLYIVSEEMCTCILLYMNPIYIVVECLLCAVVYWRGSAGEWSSPIRKSGGVALPHKK